ncbi:A/G-specific adenine glycosylase [Exiguobacterium sp. CH10]|uniref:A/G-specific adenine glycosylase n=1 Tax=Exiguobacterium sp. CH10 TaxID=2751261 RepID=UPI001BE7A3B3|nr:A/G-specific adenine glycosylase [Exiguobacterium sp. CH10]
MLNLDKLFTNYNIHQFNEELVTWFNREKRDLPWRHAKNPYRVWVSEVMLQQTRVDTVIPYYNRFMERFPTLEALASAKTEEVVKYWEGLGYYSRIRNLHEAVKEVASVYDGIVPEEKERFEKLKGVGPYTTGAVLSIAYNQPEPAVDGNVMRVMSRQFGIYDDIAVPKTRKLFEQVVRRLMDPTHASEFNEGVMELGATVCTPKNPMCSLCPVQDTCYAYAHHVQDELPVKTKKGAARVEMYDALCIEKDGKVAYEQRPDKGLLAGMWQYPLTERGTGEQVNGTYLGQVKHVFSHIVWYIDLYRVDTLPTDDVVWLDASEREVKTVSVAQQKLERLAGGESETV